MVLGFGFCCKLFVMKTSLVLGLECAGFVCYWLVFMPSTVLWSSCKRLAGAPRANCDWVLSPSARLGGAASRGVDSALGSSVANPIHELPR